MTASNNLVSIIIPAYNASNYLEQAIESALNQSYKNIEIIVVNDGSNDNNKTRDIAQKYSSKIIYLEKPNGGCASALNYGIAHMHGEWFSWLSHDDLYDKDKIKDQIDCLNNNPNCKLLYSNTKNINRKNKILRVGRSKLLGRYTNFNHLILFGRSFCGCGFLIHKTILEKIGLFNEKLVIFPDLDYWLRISLYFNEFIVPNSRCLVFNRVHGKQVTIKKNSLFNVELPLMIQNIFDEAIKINNIDILNDLYVYSKINNLNINTYHKINNTDELDKQIKKMKRKSRFTKFLKAVYWKIVRLFIAR